MPIRMRKDRKSGSNKDNHPGQKPSSGGGGGQSPLVYFLPMILGLFKKSPKLMIVLAIIAAGFYFFGGGCGGATEGNTNLPTDVIENLFSTGWSEDAKEYSATSIFEPLADNVNSPLPEVYSLKKYAPTRRNQGRQGSCVAWASSYAARTILEARRTGKSPNSLAFSPAYLYNQIALPNCQGAYLPEAMKTMKQNGGLPFSQFDYDESSCSDEPNNMEKSLGAEFNINGYTRLTVSDSKEIDMLAIKQHLFQGAPVVIGMMVGGTFMNDMRGQEKWSPSARDYDQKGFGGHAMCVIGYDDYKYGDEGGFEIMNSWGQEWGKDGIGWVRYKDFDYFVKEAYGIFPMGNADERKTPLLDAKIDLVTESGKQVNFTQVTEMEFTTSDLTTGDLFKMEVTNSKECYIYIFGEDVDAPAYVLFPYTEKHSPYCGITGTRLFPKDYSMEMDGLATSGENKDRMAVIISEGPLDYNVINDQINKASGSFLQKIEQVVGNASGMNLSDGASIQLSTNLSQKKAVGVVVSISK